MIKTKVAVLEGRPFSSQLELFDNFSDCSDWPDKSRPSKKTTFVLIMKQAICDSAHVPPTIRNPANSVNGKNEIKTQLMMMMCGYVVKLLL